ncbi:MAG TPA: polysaccharide deacetylase family protein [Caulobacteraceae bacterium]|nr:polysaccharide deacetylase family protein [Caulobacteraceae bacterium]
MAKRIPVKPVRSKLTRAVASLSFDDVPRSATMAGAEAMEAAGLRGTYYVCGGHTGATFEGLEQHDLADLRRLRDAGHEIGCHTFAHQDATVVREADRQRDHNSNLSFAAEALAGHVPATFAYPYGSTSIRSKMFYSSRFLVCRGVLAGLNAGVIDFAELRAVGLESHRGFDPVRLADLVAEARERAGWLVFFTHDVSPDPSPFGCRREELESVIGALADAAIEVLPIKDAAARVLAG